MEGCSRKYGSSFSTSKKILVSFCNVCLNVKSKMGSSFNLCFVFQLVSWLLVWGLFFFLTVVRALFQIYTLCVGQKIEYSVWRRKWIIYISCTRTWLSLSLRIYALGNLSKKKKKPQFWVSVIYIIVHYFGAILSMQKHGAVYVSYSCCFPSECFLCHFVI